MYLACLQVVSVNMHVSQYKKIIEEQRKQIADLKQAAADAHKAGVDSTIKQLRQALSALVEADEQNFKLLLDNGLVDVDVQTKTRQAQLAAKELLATEVEGKGEAETDEKEVWPERLRAQRVLADGLAACRLLHPPSCRRRRRALLRQASSTVRRPAGRTIPVPSPDRQAVLMFRHGSAKEEGQVAARGLGEKGGACSEASRYPGGQEESAPGQRGHKGQKARELQTGGRGRRVCVDLRRAYEATTVGAWHEGGRGDHHGNQAAQGCPCPSLRDQRCREGEHRRAGERPSRVAASHHTQIMREGSGSGRGGGEGDGADRGDGAVGIIASCEGRELMTIATRNQCTACNVCQSWGRDAESWATRSAIVVRRTSSSLYRVSAALRSDTWSCSRATKRSSIAWSISSTGIRAEPGDTAAGRLLWWGACCKYSSDSVSK